MKIYFRYLSVILLSLSLTGCFEIIEEITIRDDGSGTITMTVNFSQSRTKLNSIMLMDSIQDYKVPSRNEIKEQLLSMVQEIKGVAGVTNVDHSMNFKDYIFSVSGDFANIDVLNKVIIHFVTSKSEVRDLKRNKQFVFDSKKKSFKRNYHYNLSTEIENVRRKDRKVLDGASITTIYRFESPVKSCDNTSAKISGSKKAVMLKVSANEMITNRKNIKNTIYLN